MSIVIDETTTRRAVKALTEFNEAVASFAEAVKHIDTSELAKISSECRIPTIRCDFRHMRAKTAQGVNLPRFRTKELPYRLGN